jgi:hypothetical protein
VLTPEISDARAASSEQARLWLELNLAKTNHEVAAARLAQAEERVRAEAGDVAVLESVTPTRLWAAMRGTRSEDLDRERSELSAVQAEAAALKLAWAEAGAVRQQIQAALIRLGDVSAQWRQALNVEEGRLLDAGGGAAAQLVEISGQRAAVAAQRAEVAQAQAAARVAVSALKAAAQLLDSAESWSTYDTFFGGGMLASMAKHDRMDAASAELKAADSALERLSSELADVGLAAVGGIDVDELTRTFDIWFDNIFTDWSVADRISEAAERTQRAVRAVDTASARLRVRDSELVALGVTLAKAREDTILGR